METVVNNNNNGESITIYGIAVCKHPNRKDVILFIANNIIIVQVIIIITENALLPEQQFEI